MADSLTKQKLDDLKNSLPVGDEHCEPTREMLRVTAHACNGADNKIQALSEAVGSVAYFLAVVHRGEPDRIASAMRECIAEHVKTCQGASMDGREVMHEAWDANGRQTKGTGWEKLQGVLLDNARLIIICITIVTSALATRKLPSLVDIVKAVAPIVQTANVQPDADAKN